VSAGHEDHEGGEAEEGLGKAGVNYCKIKFDEHDAQAAKDALEDDGGEDGIGEVANGAALFDAPGPEGKEDGAETDDRSHEAVGVFVEDSADPEARREEEHVVAVAVGPIGDRHAGLMRSDQATHEDQWESGGGGEEREPVKGRVVTGLLHGFN